MTQRLNARPSQYGLACLRRPALPQAASGLGPVSQSLLSCGARLEGKRMTSGRRGGALHMLARPSAFAREVHPVV